MNLRRLSLPPPALFLPLLAGACATGGVPLAARHPPLYVGGGAGSQYGNYAAQPSGEMTGPDGQPCRVFTWDRPLTDTLAVRLRSASCPSKEHPGLMTATELDRSVIPLSQSLVAREAP